MRARAFALGIAAFAAAGCGIVAGLPSDYGLADASSVADAGGDAMSVHDASSGTDAGGEGDGDASADVVAPDASVDASDGGVDTGPIVPPSDPANIACGSAKCAVSSKVCCAETGMTSCVSNTSPSCNGVIAECDESANCASSERCCVTSVRSYGLETRCSSSACGGRGWQSCRTNAECPGGQTCVAWTCAGHTVATCSAFGSDGGCM